MQIDDLFGQDEPSIDATLDTLWPVAPKLKFIRYLNPVYQYSDEPKIFQFAASLSYSQEVTDGNLDTSKRGGGSSFISKEHAFIKCLGEAIERYSCSVYRNKDFIFSSYNKIGGNALDPESVVNFSKFQKNQPKFRDFIYDRDSTFNWTKATTLSGESVYVPAQLVYFTYKFLPNEGRILIPISTGAAGGGSPAAALVRGILEIVERDSFLIHYLNKLPGKKVALRKIKDDRLQKILNTLERYNLQVHVIDITTDLMIPSFAAFVLDPTNIGPAMQVGLKASLNPVEAIIEAIHEAMHIRSWLRQTHENGGGKNRNIKPDELHTVEQKGLYWYSKAMLVHLDFWLKSKKTADEYQLPVPLTFGSKLKKLKNIFEAKNYPIYFTDLTIPEVSDSKFVVYKVIIPQLQPMYLHEGYRYLGGERLYEVPEKLGYKKKAINDLNQIPHPFL